MDIYNAIENYNRHRKTDKIFFSWIATKLGISKQALYNLTLHGGKKGILKYKDKLEEILPKELFETIDFPEKKLKKETSRALPRRPFDANEKALLKEHYWVVGKSLYTKIMNNEGVTDPMHDKIMDKIEEAKKWVEENQAINKEIVNKVTIEIDGSIEEMIAKIDSMSVSDEVKKELKEEINGMFRSMS